MFGEIYRAKIDCQQLSLTLKPCESVINEELCYGRLAKLVGKYS